MTELKKGKANIALTGRVKLNENSFSGEKVSERTGYRYKQVRFGVETAEGNTVYCELMGGYSPSNPVVNVTSKEDNKPFTIGWADRQNETIMKSIADFKKHKTALEKNEKGDLVTKEFLSGYDLHDYLEKHLMNDMEVTVIGSLGYREYKEETQRTCQIQSVYIPYTKKDEAGNVIPVEYKARFVQTILLDEDSFKRITKEDAKEGEVTVSAMVVDYVGKVDGKEIKKNLTFSQPITVKIDKENPEKTSKILDKMFKVPKGKVRELTIEGEIVEGYEQVQASSTEVKFSNEIMELIEMGYYTEEEAKKKMMIRGNKVSKLVFTRPFIRKDDNGDLIIPIDDTKYTPEDLYPPMPEDEKNEEDPFADLKDEGSGSDDDWMKALNM